MKYDNILRNREVRDKQEDKINRAIKNFENHLSREKTWLFFRKMEIGGSYARDTLINPLNDIDLFVVLDKGQWSKTGKLPSPKSILSKLESHLNTIPDYTGSVRKDWPCVRVNHSQRSYDLIPAFQRREGSGYLIPGPDRETWIETNPQKLEKDLNKANYNCKHRLKKAIKLIKYWNHKNGSLIPSYHIEETAIRIIGHSVPSDCSVDALVNRWFRYAVDNMKNKGVFKSAQLYQEACNKVRKANRKLDLGHTIIS